MSMPTDQLFRKLDEEARAGGYTLNPDKEFTMALIEGLAKNIERYGYPACPCRLASGTRKEDLDLICPCDYRDPDLDEYETCYCALYVSGRIAAGEAPLRSIPDRRPPDGPQKQIPHNLKMPLSSDSCSAALNLPLPVYRCKVCGYLCARENPPSVCPICKVSRDRFERFI